MRRFPLLLVSGLLLLACGRDLPPPPAPQEVRSARSRLQVSPTAEDRRAWADGQAAFAFDLHRTLPATGNLAHSPFSVSLTMAMAWAGARGSTEAELSRALHFTLPAAQQHAAFNAVERELAGRGAMATGADGGPFRMKLPNALWAAPDLTFVPAYLDALVENYGVGVQTVPFGADPDGARRSINDWVEQATERKIRELVPAGSVDGQTKLILTNAVYFNAAWATSFSEEATTPLVFFAQDGTQVTVPFMRRGGELTFAEGTGWKAVSLPYQDTRLSMLLVLPDPGTMSSFEAALTPEKLGEIVNALERRTGSLYLPRFRFTTALRLTSSFQKLGVATAFDAGADFSGIDGTRQLFIRAIEHQAFIAIGEKGTEASAATAVQIAAKSGPLQPHLRFSHPFLFFIRDQPTGALLFMGRVANPR